MLKVQMQWFKKVQAHIYCILASDVGMKKGPTHVMFKAEVRQPTERMKLDSSFSYMRSLGCDYIQLARVIRGGCVLYIYARAHERSPRPPICHFLQPNKGSQRATGKEERVLEFLDSSNRTQCARNIRGEWDYSERTAARINSRTARGF